MNNEDLHQRQVIRLGSHVTTPNVRSVCIGKLSCNDAIVDARYEQESQWVIGEGDTELCELIDDCLLCMHADDICKFTLKRDESYDILKEEDIQIEQDLEVTYEVELKQFSKAKDTWHCTVEELFNEAKCSKARGVTLYKDGKIAAAARRFGIALKYLIVLESDGLADQKDEYYDLRKTCYLNLATCQAKHNMHQAVIDNCSKVLRMEPSNLKALFKRGIAYTVLSDFDNAKADLDSAKQLDPTNKAVITAVQDLSKKTRQRNKYYQQALASMFQGKDNK